MKSHSLEHFIERNPQSTHGVLRPHMDVLSVAIGAYLIVAALLIFVLARLVHNAPYLPIDLTITRAVQSFNPPWFDFMMRAVNWLGFGLQSTGLVAFVVLVTYLAGWRWEAVVAAVDAATVWAINVDIGMLVARPYPAPGPDLNGILVDLTRPSFPSGHASSFIAIYGLMWYLVYHRVKNPWVRLPLLVVFGALVILVTPSRVYTGRHWPTDTLAGVLIGTIWLIGSIGLYRWGKQKAWVRKRFADTQPVWQH